MKKSRKALLWGILALSLLGYLIWHFATHYAYKQIWVDLGPVPEARTNPYYAAQKFLEKKGYKVKTSGLLAEVTGRLDDTDTLFLFYDHELEYQTLSTDIHEWVKRGGHLVLTVHYLWDEDNNASGDVYLDQLGVRQYLWPRETEGSATDESEAAENENPSDDNAEDEALPSADAEQDSEEATETDATENDHEAIDSDNGGEEASSDNVEPDSADDNATPLKNLNIPVDSEEETMTCGMPNAESVALLPLSQGSHPLHIAFESEYHVEDVSGNAHAPFTAPPAHMLQYTVGAGKITVLTDYFIFNDSNIGDYDHAFFLWSLADTSPRVWMIYDKDSDTLIQLLWASAPYLCISVLALLGGWLIYRGRRFGPILSIEHASRRQLQEHIDASTSYIWRSEEQASLIDEARQPVLNKCPIIDNQLSRTPRLLRAMEQLGISEERLLWALTTPSVDDEAEFIELIRLLQQLRTTL